MDFVTQELQEQTKGRKIAVLRYLGNWVQSINVF